MLIETKKISKFYSMGDTEVDALFEVSLEMEKGEFTVIMGPSGSGKSTLMNILGCLDSPSNGRYFLEGVDVSKLGRDRLAEIRNKKTGFIFQGFNLLPRTSAIENVELPMLYNGISAKDRRLKAIMALKIVGLEGRENHHPGQLSGGQQQRVAIARSIVNDAPIILADEPTGNLDTRTGTEIMEIFVKLNRESGVNIILVTHDPDIATYGKHIIKFLDGRIVSDEVMVK